MPLLGSTVCYDFVNASRLANPESRVPLDLSCFLSTLQQNGSLAKPRDRCTTRWRTRGAHRRVSEGSLFNFLPLTFLQSDYRAVRPQDTIQIDAPGVSRVLQLQSSRFQRLTTCSPRWSIAVAGSRGRILKSIRREIRKLYR